MYPPQNVSKWIKIASSGDNIKDIDLKGVHWHRKQCMLLAIYIHRSKMNSKKYPTLVINEYIRQLMGPEVYDQVRTAIGGNGSKLNYSELVDLFILLKEHSCDGKFGD